MTESGYCLWWRSKGFGEPLMAGMFTSILNDNGINAVFYNHRAAKGLLDCPEYDKNNEMHQAYKKMRWRRGYDPTKKPIILQMIPSFEKRTGKKIKITRDCVPVKFYDIPDVPFVDVVMCTQTGKWAPNRNWPYFDELKKLLNREQVSFVDLNAEKIRSIECLNYVKKCKLYLGLETGTSHYVSQFANGKALILQSGFSEFNFWTYPYDYECLQADSIQCSPCFVTRKITEVGKGCKYNHVCMREISAERVFTRIIQKILSWVDIKTG